MFVTRSLYSSTVLHVLLIMHFTSAGGIFEVQRRRISVHCNLVTEPEPSEGFFLMQVFVGFPEEVNVTLQSPRWVKRMVV